MKSFAKLSSRIVELVKKGGEKMVKALKDMIALLPKDDAIVKKIVVNAMIGGSIGCCVGFGIFGVMTFMDLKGVN